MYQFVVSPCVSPPDEPFPFWKQLPRAPALRFGKYWDMFGNRWNFRSEQLRNLRLRQPYAVALHADFQTGLAVGRLVYDNFPSVHTNKYRKICPHLQKSSRLDFSPKIAIFVLSCKKIRRWRRQNRQADARPCKKAVDDTGIRHRKPLQTVDIH